MPAFRRHLVGAAIIRSLLFAWMVGAYGLAEAIDDEVRLPVPYIRQPKALCGGAAATMVFRYWGDEKTDVRQFAPLVDHRAGGIASDALARAIEDQAWRTVQFRGSIDSMKERIRAGQPVIALTREGRERFHYVVTVGFGGDHIVLHDPARGPFRRVPLDRFVRAWDAAGSWALLVLPKS